MSTKKPGISGTAAAAVVGLLLFHGWLIFVKTHDAFEIDVRPNTVPSPNIMGDLEIGQTFVAPSNGLSRIDLMMATHRRTNDREVVFRLWELRPERHLVRETIFNPADTADNLYRAFAFDPIPQSGGKTYVFTLNSPASTLSNSLSVWMNEADIYPGGRAILNGQPLTGDLTFRTYSRKTPAGAWGRILAQVTGLPGSWSAVLLAAAFVLFEAVQIAFLLALVGNLKNRRVRTGFHPEAVRA
jgi:hypothetical protein